MSAFAQTIVSHLTLASNNAMALAVAWHIAGALVIAALLFGWRPSKRQAGVLAAAPIVSAAAVALVFGNPFNAAVLIVLALSLFALAMRLDSERIERGPGHTTGAGVLLVVFGAVYPHFLDAESVVDYAYAAPMGVVPCPTLAIVVGFTLIANGLGSRAWCLTLATAGLFYGVVGAAFLGVLLDVVLVAGASLLLRVALVEVPFRDSRDDQP